MPVLCEYAVRKIRKKQWLTGAISASLKDTGLSRRCHAALESETVYMPQDSEKLWIA